MSVLIQKIEILKQKISKDFADVSYPKGLLAPHDCEECREVRKTFANKNWKTIEPKILEENFGIISLFSPEAFHFFLPTYLIYSLDNLDKKYNNVTEFTTYAVTIDKDIKENPSYWQGKFANFTLNQLGLIYEFLDIIKQRKDFEDFVTNIERGKERFKTFIEPILKN